jgi:hypothetical protein
VEQGADRRGWNNVGMLHAKLQTRDMLQSPQAGREGDNAGVIQNEGMMVVRFFVKFSSCCRSMWTGQPRIAVILRYYLHHWLS